MEAGRQFAARLVRGALVRTQTHGDDRAQLRFRAAHAFHQGSGREVSADRSQGRGRRGLRAQRRCGRSVEPHPGLCARRQGGGRQVRRGRARDRVRRGRPARDARAHRQRRDRLRDRRQRRRHLGARRRQDGGRGRARRRGRTPVSDHRKAQRHAQGPADFARPRQHFLSEARTRGARHRRLGTRNADLRGERREFRFRARASAAQPGTARSLPAAGGRAPADPERNRHPDRHQRPDPDFARRRADPGPGPRARQFLRRLRLHLGHRRLGRCRQSDGRMDRRGRTVDGSLGVRRAPLRQAPHVGQVSGRAQRGLVLALLSDPLPGRGPDLRARRAALAALRPAQGARRRVRLALRLGAAQLVRPPRQRGRRPAVLRSAAQLVRPRSRGVPRGPRAGRSHRPILVLEIRDRGSGRVRRLATRRRQRSRQARRRFDLYAALQRARRDRSRPDLRASRREPLLHGHRQRVRRARPRLDRKAPAARRLGDVERRDLGARGRQSRRPAVARYSGQSRRGRRVERRLSVHDRQGNPHRFRAGARLARDLSGRARLGTPHAGRVRGACARAADRGGGGIRREGRRLSRHRIPAPGEALSLLGCGHHARLHALRGRARLLRRAGQEIGLHRPRGAGESQDRRPQAQTDRADGRCARAALWRRNPDPRRQNARCCVVGRLGAHDR